MTPVELSEMIRNYAIVAAGIVGIGLAIWRAIVADRQSRAAEQQSMTARRSHVTEVFTEAVGLLGNDRLEIRLGAIYTLQQISRDFEEFNGVVFDLLTAYVRERAEANDPTADIVEIMRFLNVTLAMDSDNG